MHTISAHEAKARFGQLLDTARAEPVTIEKHGRPVAVLVSKQEYDKIQAIKLEHLRAEVQEGIEAIDTGDASGLDEDGLGQLASEIKTRGREGTASS